MSEILTDTGLEVEGLEKIESIPGGLRGVVVGRVETCVKHENADKLKVCKVNIGGASLLDIVCGAPNVAAGQLVLVATVGTLIYTDEGSFEIKKSKIRGAVSEGMLCAEDELGLGASHDGIVVLEKNYDLGMAAADVYQIETDYVFEIGLTPNRTDAMGHYGVARDIHAYLQRHNRRSKLELSQLNWQESPAASDVSVKIENEEACNRYMGVRISNVSVSSSPEWLQNKLKAIGLSPINNVVDATNYIMHAFGQPLHAFDKDQIQASEVRVKTLSAGSKFVTLDETERELHEHDLMICDGQDRGMCIAGVFGGIKSGVSDETKEIFLESANFNSVWVRKTAKRHALNTDASFRYERGIDAEACDYSLKAAAALIAELTGGQISSSVVDLYPNKTVLATVEFSVQRMLDMAGQEIEVGLIKNILAALDIEIIKEDGDKWMLQIPGYRVDVTREADVMEEVLRIYGYNEIRLSGRISASIGAKPDFDLDQAEHKISELLASNGFAETMSNSLSKASYIDGWDSWKQEHFVEMLNPLSSDLAILRQSLLFNGLEIIAYNQNRKRPDLRIFEFGKTYQLFGDKKVEKKQLSLFVSGELSDSSWMNEFNEPSFYYLKSVLDLVLGKMGIQDVQLKELSLEFANQSLQLKLGKMSLAMVSVLGKKLLKQFDIEVPVVYAEVDWEQICLIAAKKSVKFSPISKFPGAKRDLALLVQSDLNFEELKQTAFRTEKKFLKEVNLFDVYEGKNLPENKKSYGLSFLLQDEGKTLSDKQIDKSMRKLQEAFEKQHQAELRS